MNTLSKLLLPSLFIAMMFSFNNSSQAQIINENSTNVTDVDPIAATLDSLVNLTYVQRLNLNSTAPANNSFKSFEIPAYSADIYKKRIEKLVSLLSILYLSSIFTCVSSSIYTSLHDVLSAAENHLSASSLTSNGLHATPHMFVATLSLFTGLNGMMIKLFSSL